ncbi:MAG TPA: methyltransferase [Methylomirabilota bacterium]|nr:methyltransferase [Methylomirabilota bacterium]
MTHKLTAEFRSLGATRRYADGGEQRVLEVLANAEDRTDGSDELRRLASDWPTTYHLSPARSNLVRPIAIGPDHRILEVGAGTGALTRHLGERGARVLALEGDATRAKAVALRCSDLDNVEVVCGLLEELEDPDGFDLVVVIGVLEYAGGAPGADHPHLEFLRRAAGLVRPEGALLLAIENQIGLKYLLGFSEDHLDEPWAGLAGYPGNPAVRTFSRTGLGSLLETSGLPAQRWYYPYPDYKMPSAILAVEAFEIEGATDFVDQLVGLPVRDPASPPTLFCDSRAAHRVFLDAGLGPDVANSFLVLAGRGATELERWIDPGAVAWHFASERRRRWRRFHVVRREGDALHLTSRPTHDGDRPAPAEWMQQLSSKDESYVTGPTVEQEALDACRRRDLDALRVVLARWHTSLLHNERPAPPPVAAHPYAATGARALPPDFFDANLSNFVDTGGTLAFVDREWHVGTGVDPDLARFRALWYLALDLVVSGVEQPFEPGATVTDITRRLVEMVDVVAEADLIERFYSAEAEVQAIVTGADAAAIERDLRRLGATSRSESAAVSTLPVNRVRRDLIELGESLRPLRNRIAELEAAIGERDHQIEAVSEELVRVADWARSLESELGRAQRWATELNELAGRKLEIEDALRRDLAETSRQVEANRAEAERLRSEREAVAAELGHLERRSQRLARELEQYRAWEAKWTRKPLVRAALILHRLLGGGNSSH